ncbi:MAG: MarR family transcriptional regulator [Candidatus Peregrinibacteria bacterium Greene0416_19]|nr:MAG: MarR family transcriptional regulator [Candidatus Peregrinibacteria bacterium Greene0416_19]
MGSHSADANVSMLQLHALFFIDQHPGVTMKEVAELLSVTSPSATSFIDRLVKLGWVERLQDERNRKLVRLRMTERGRSVVQEKMAEKRKSMRQLLEALSHVEQIQLRDILYHLAKNLERP